MALTKTVTKKSVSGNQESINIITFNLSLKEDTIEVINKDFSVEWRKGENIADKVKDVTAQMQSEINSYKAQKVIFDSAALNNAVNSIQGELIC
jgi:hypothetical protein